jgi:hypothetical protein
MEKSANVSELAWAQKLSTDIFKHGTLINVTIGFWEGKVHQTSKDVEVLNADIDNDIYAPGFKWLIPPVHTRPFTRYRSRLNSVMEKMSYRVPGMRGSRFVPKDAYSYIKDFLGKEKEDFFAQREVFLDKYPELIKEQIDKFNARYPDHTGTMDTLYPRVDQIRDKFSYSWTPYSWSHTDIQEIAQDAKAKLVERSTELIYQSGIQIRRHIIDATESIVNAIKNGKNTVNIRAVNAFTQRLEQLKHLNLFSDPEINNIINGAERSLTSISSWKKEDVDETDIEARLSDMVRTLQGEVAEIEKNPEELLVFKRAILTSDSEEEDSSDEVVTSVTRLLNLDGE